MNLSIRKISVTAAAFIIAALTAYPQPAFSQAPPAPSTGEVAAAATAEVKAGAKSDGTTPVDIENMNLNVVGGGGAEKPVNVQQEVNQEEVIAKIGAREIRMKELTEKLDSLPPWVPRDAVKRDEKLKILDRLVKEAMIDAELKEKNFESNESVKEILSEVEKKIVFQSFIENEIKTSVKDPSDAEIKEFYEKNSQKMGGATLEQAKPQISQVLKNEKIEAHFNGILKKICADYELATNEAAIQKLKDVENIGEKDASLEIFKMKGGGVTLGDVKRLVKLDKIMNPGRPAVDLKDEKVLSIVLDNILKASVLTKAAGEKGFGPDKNPKVGEELAKFKTTQLKKLYLELGLEYKNKFTEEDKKKYFEEHKNEFGEGEQVRASHILVDSEEKAKEIEKKLAEGGKFEELAKAESKCPSKENGGDLNYFKRGQMVKEFEDAAFAGEVGKILPPVKTKFGYHVIKVTEKKAAKAPEYKDFEGKIADLLKNAEKMAAVKKFEEDLAKKYKYEVYPDKIK